MIEPLSAKEFKLPRAGSTPEEVLSRLNTYIRKARSSIFCPQLGADNIESRIIGAKARLIEVMKSEDDVLSSSPAFSRDELLEKMKQVELQGYAVIIKKYLEDAETAFGRYEASLKEIVEGKILGNITDGQFSNATQSFRAAVRCYGQLQKLGGILDDAEKTQLRMKALFEKVSAYLIPDIDVAARSGELLTGDIDRLLTDSLERVRAGNNEALPNVDSLRLLSNDE